MYSDNDDDLFEYEYVETKTDSINEAFKESSSELNDFQNKLNIDISESDIDDKGFNLHGRHIQLSLAYHKAYEQFVYETVPLSLAKSFTITLDTLTNGDFSLISKFYSLEMIISRKLLFLQLSFPALQQGPKYISILKEIGNVLKIEIDDFFIQNFFLTTLEICEFTIKLHQAEYLTLSKRLGIPVNQALFASWEEALETDHNVYLDAFKHDVSERILVSNIENGMLQEIANILGREPKISAGNVQENF
jgi:hypothetical protein